MLMFYRVFHQISMHLITIHLSNGFGSEQNHFPEGREDLLGCRGLWDFSMSYHPLPPGISPQTGFGAALYSCLWELTFVFTGTLSCNTNRKGLATG